MIGVSNMNLPVRLKELRKKKHNMTQEEVAEKIHISRQTLSNWETGKSYPDLQSLLYLLELYNTTLYDLVNQDITTMKSKVIRRDIYILAYLFLMSIIVFILSIVAFIKINLFISIVTISLSIACLTVTSLKLERIKKENNITTFNEVIKFINKCE
jgi:transcriptional regulator with XRE-family HTH domain